MKIAIVRLSALGDIAHTSVVLQFICKKIKNIKIDWVVDKKFASILENNPFINNIISIDLKEFKRKKSITLLFKQIRLLTDRDKYDIVIDAQGLLKSAIVAKLLPCNIRYGYSFYSAREFLAPIFYTHRFNIPYESNTIDKNLRLIEKSLNIKIDKQEIQNKKAHLGYMPSNNQTLKKLIDNRPVILFVIGSTWESRNYPKEKIANIINRLKYNSLILWGNSEEKDRGLWITKNCKYATLLPKIDTNSLKELISKVDLVVGNDTGPTHIAWAMNIPSITLFGPTPPNRIHITKINKLLKSPSIVNPKKLNKNDFSISKIKEDDIINLIKGLIKC